MAEDYKTCEDVASLKPGQKVWWMNKQDINGYSRSVVKEVIQSATLFHGKPKEQKKIKIEATIQCGTANYNRRKSLRTLSFENAENSIILDQSGIAIALLQKKIEEQKGKISAAEKEVAALKEHLKTLEDELKAKAGPSSKKPKKAAKPKRKKTRLEKKASMIDV